MNRDSIISVIVIDVIALGLIALMLINISKALTFMPWYGTKSIFDIVFDVYLVVIPSIIVLGIVKFFILIFSGIIRQGLIDLILGGLAIFIPEISGVITLESGSLFSLFSGLILFLWVLFGMIKNIKAVNVKPR